MEEMNLPYSSTSALCVDKPLCEFFEKTASSVKDPQKAANWVVNDLLRELGQTDTEENNQKILSNCPVSPEMLAELINLIEMVWFPIMWRKNYFRNVATGKSAKELVKKKVWR